MAPKFTHRVRKQKAKARLAEAQSQDLPDAPVPESHFDSNTLELPSSRRQDLLKNLRASQPNPSHISSKKAKRLEHYIDTKLKKEENQDLIKKLAEQKIDTSLLRSSKNLGRGEDTKRETLQRALREVDRGLHLEDNKTLLYEKRPIVEELESGPLSPEKDQVQVEPSHDLQKTTALSNGIVKGSGLKRPLELDEDGRPIIQTRKRIKIGPKLRKFGLVHDVMNHAEEEGESDEWNGFSDDQGANGSKENGDHAFGTDSDEEDENDGEEMDSGEDDFSDEGGSDEDDNDSDMEDDSEDEEDGDEDGYSSATMSPEVAPKRSSIFKAWADQQRNQVLDFQPSGPITTGDSSQTGALLPAITKQPLNYSAPAVPPLNIESVAKASHVVVTRSEEIQEARSKLPVVQDEQRIMEAINANKITIICAETGSGKTTQVPQMMIESGYGSSIGNYNSTSKNGLVKDLKTKGMIGVTQPRRVAATSVAERVKTEMGDMANRIGYQVRFDTTVNPSTAIKFMTDGILLREVANDFMLSRYSAIVIDEAHERTVNTDILIGLLSRIVDLRQSMAEESPEKVYPLKLVIMSATLRVEDFTRNNILFRNGPPPIVQAEGRQYDVVNHFARQTHRDYMEEMFQKICRGHKKLPKGGMLVFLTGQVEILALMKRLQNRLKTTSTTIYSTNTRQGGPQLLQEDDDDMTGTVIKARLAGEVGSDDNEADEDAFIDGLDDYDQDAEFQIEEQQQAGEDDQKVHVLPLYSQLPSKEQLKVFQQPPEGSRLIVLATNVAETSLTIPGIRYVFDCGRAKEKQYDTKTGVQKFEIGWISKASAAQRAGRAGRTGPGHCYKLYSSAVFERDFEDYTVPEILRSPVENVALMVKAVDFPNVASFPFPTPPDRHALARAEELLKFLGAIDSASKITDMGRKLMNYPLNPRYGRILLLASSHGLVAHAIALVSSLAIPELLINETQVVPRTAQKDSDEDRHGEEDDVNNMKLRDFKRAQSIMTRWDAKSDAMKLMMASILCSNPRNLSEQCAEFFVREKGMSEVLDLRSQLVRIVQTQQPELSSDSLTNLPILSGESRSKLMYILAAGFADQVAIRADLLNNAAADMERKPRRAIEVPYRTLIPSKIHKSGDNNEDKNVYIHPSSVLGKLTVDQMPNFIIYDHLSTSAVKVVSDVESHGKTRMHPLTAVTAKQLVALMDGTPLFEIGKPIGKIMALSKGEDGRDRREVWVSISLKSGEGTRWDIGTRKERQIRRGLDWITEQVLG